MYSIELDKATISLDRQWMWCGMPQELFSCALRAERTSPRQLCGPPLKRYPVNSAPVKRCPVRSATALPSKAFVAFHFHISHRILLKMRL
jgi:hypothetical protein